MGIINDIFRRHAEAYLHAFAQLPCEPRKVIEARAIAYKKSVKIYPEFDPTEAVVLT